MTDQDRSASPLAGLVGFTSALRCAGLACDATRTDAYLQAVQWLDPADPADLYWAGRLTLCAEPDDLPRYDEAFAAWFTPIPIPRPRIVSHAATETGADRGSAQRFHRECGWRTERSTAVAGRGE